MAGTNTSSSFAQNNATVEKSARMEKEEEITKALTFAIGEQVYGIEIPYVVEIIGVPKITRVPCAEVPYFIKGIINVRSKVVPVVNIRSCFGKEEIEYNEKTCTIIVAMNDVTVGLIVDEVLEVLSVMQKNIAKTPDLNNVNENKFIEYILEMNDGIKLILDIKKIVFDHDLMFRLD
ncbi:MAG: chemotaxis protein CheW [Oscillospiraceae bacterium]|jgi:purine-binding chemotaxis protein CheW|nr:chemotaxis protein CheW [Oscillospiraceae bacterium]